MRVLSRTLTVIENALVVISIVYLFSIIGLITFDVIGRQLGTGSLPWIVEVAEYFLLFSTFMCSAWVLRERGHIVVDFIDGFLTENGLRRLRIAAYVVTFATVGYLLWFTGKLGLNYFQRGTSQGNFIMVPQWVLYGPIPVGIFLFLLELIRQFSRFLRKAG